jgi:hypothetical protein
VGEGGGGEEADTDDAYVAMHTRRCRCRDPQTSPHPIVLNLGLLALSPED